MRPQRVVPLDIAKFDDKLGGMCLGPAAHSGNLIGCRRRRRVRGTAAPDVDMFLPQPADIAIQIDWAYLFLDADDADLLSLETERLIAKRTGRFVLLLTNC